MSTSPAPSRPREDRLLLRRERRVPVGTDPDQVPVLPEAGALGTETAGPDPAGSGASPHTVQ
jgi:hypothetical protein